MKTTSVYLRMADTEIVTLKDLITNILMNVKLKIFNDLIQSHQNDQDLQRKKRHLARLLSV